MFCSTTVRACRYGECAGGPDECSQAEQAAEKCYKTRKKLPSGALRSSG